MKILKIPLRTTAKRDRTRRVRPHIASATLAIVSTLRTDRVSRTARTDRVGCKGFKMPPTVPSRRITDTAVQDFVCGGRSGRNIRGRILVPRHVVHGSHLTSSPHRRRYVLARRWAPAIAIASRMVEPRMRYPRILRKRGNDPSAMFTGEMRMLGDRGARKAANCRFKIVARKGSDAGRRSVCLGTVLAAEHGGAPQRWRRRRTARHIVPS